LRVQAQIDKMVIWGVATDENELKGSGKKKKRLIGKNECCQAWGGTAWVGDLAFDVSLSIDPFRGQ